MAGYPRLTMSYLLLRPQPTCEQADLMIPLVALSPRASILLRHQFELSSPRVLRPAFSSHGAGIQHVRRITALERGRSMDCRRR